MAALDQYEEQQLQAIKDWWKSYGKFTVIVIIAAIAFSFAYRYWRAHEIETRAQASMLYEQALIAQAANKTEAFHQLANLITEKYKSSTYADFVMLLKAKNEVDAQKYDLALKDLAWVGKNANNQAIKQIANLRYARILIMQKQMQPALAVLSKVDDKAFLPAIEVLRGDIYASLGENQPAAMAYQNALDQLPKTALERNFIEMKLSQVATDTTS